MSSTPTHSSNKGLGPLFVGYTIGTALFGITIFQAYQYFTNYPKDSRLRKGFATLVCILDLSHMIIGAKMFYSIMIPYESEPNFPSKDKLVKIFKVGSMPLEMFIISVDNKYL
ncbi:hypothetical protein NLJ89_g5281 [Agrocybe chaxingu]|uniref:Uncharacterized protein n=1 Tax=Agrocybe chaxingu TaxID=84603 RepID=A0A9W8K1J3_9AGAR|nr:hypothetical protein NLJ89_g5281 [Agrocybe chaxingu]